MILVLVPIWQRPEILNIWAMSMQNFQSDEVTVLCILSREDPDFDQNLNTVCRNDFSYCLFKNKPLGEKLNAGIEYALENFQFDYLMNLGSDDLIHPALLALYKNVESKFFGLEKVYFFNKLTKELAITKPYLWGAGRMIHRDILSAIQKQGGFLYESKYARGLDCNSIDRIKDMLNVDYIRLNTNDFPYIVDIKSEVGINDFHLMLKMCDTTDQDVLKRFYPKNITKLLYG